jgi:hypothetical protein
LRGGLVMWRRVRQIFLHFPRPWSAEGSPLEIAQRAKRKWSRLSWPAGERRVPAGELLQLVGIMAAQQSSVSPSDNLTPVLSRIESAATLEYRIAQTIARIKAEYEEMPGLCLTSAQAARLFGLDPTICANVLAACVDAGFLRETSGRFMRV